MVPTFRLPRVINHEDPDVQRMFDEIRATLQQLVDNPFILGNKLESISLSTTVNKIEHKLGRAYQGVFALDGTGIVVDTTNDAPEREIWITLASGSRTVDLWVF